MAFVGRRGAERPILPDRGPGHPPPRISPKKKGLMSQILHFEVVLFPHRQSGSGLVVGSREAEYPKIYRTDLDKSDGCGEPIKHRTTIGLLKQ